MTDEQQLVSALQQGDEAAFRALVELHSTRVLNTCMSLVPDLHEAQDLTQEVFVEVFRSIERFRFDASLSTWIYRITCNKALEHLRRRNRLKRRAFFQRLVGLDDPAGQQIADPVNHPGIALEDKERAELLYRHLDRLPEQQKSALLLHKVEGLTHQEISDVLQVSVSAVESLIHRAKKKLRASLSGHFDRS
ncbi:MAG: RNA polymerase sigma factor [Saprospiraceae bacterium]